MDAQICGAKLEYTLLKETENPKALRHSINLFLNFLGF